MEDLTAQGSQPADPSIDPAASGTPEAGEDSGAKDAGADRQKLIFFFSFGTILFTGLALTIIYLSGRVMETKAAGSSAQTRPAMAMSKPAVIREVKPAASPIKPAEAQPASSAPKVEAQTASPKPQIAPKPETVVVAKANPTPALPAAVPPPTVVSKSVQPAKPPAPVPPIASKPQADPVAGAKITPLKTAAPADAKPVTVAKTVPIPAAAQPPAVVSKSVQPAKPPAPVPPEASKPQANPVAAAKTAPLKTAAPAPKAAQNADALARAHKPYQGPIINPHEGETYVQVGAYGPTYTLGFLASLQKKGFRGVVAPGPREDVYRVLIGPLPDTGAVKNVAADLRKAGITDSFDRNY